MTFEEMNVAIKEIDDKIIDLQNEQRNLYEQRIEDFRKEARKNIGRCFKIDDVCYVKVIDIPEMQWDANMLSHFNERLYPALYLVKEEDGMPFQYDVLHSSAWGDGDVRLCSYNEISQDEFNAEFKRRIDNFRNKIITTGDKTCLTCRMYDNPSDFLCVSCDRNYSNYEPVKDDA